ncbi:MAG: hypothetical protein NTU60_11695 [Candidatus Aminicenantes bacterium]|nr:hypothetical protein [Candidatus Aminicenantes bacterium]
MKRKMYICLLIIAVGLTLSACKKTAPVKGVELTVTFSEPALSDNLITDVEYKWKTSEDFVKLDKDYSIFVHFWHNANNLITGDYVPEIPTTKWEKGKEYTAKRRIYIPAFIDEFDPQFKGEETLRLSVGFFNPYDRSGQSEKEVLSKKLKVLPPPLGTPEVIYENGWYDLEKEPKSLLKQWRWTAKEAKCVIDNPKKDALLVIKGGVNFQAVKDQKVIFKINDLILDEFVVEQELFEKSYDVKKEQLGDKNEFTLTIGVDKPWVPAKVIPNSKDDRELGCQISFIYFR